MAQYFTLKELSEKFHDFERTKDKMIETDSNLGVWLQKISCSILQVIQWEEKGSTVWATPDTFFTKKQNTLTCNVSNVLNYSKEILVLLIFLFLYIHYWQ